MPSEQKIHNFLILAFLIFFFFQYFKETIVFIFRKIALYLFSLSLLGEIRININNDKEYYLLKEEVLKKYGSPQVGLEPTTNRLTADRSTTELLRNNIESLISYRFKDSCSLNRPIIHNAGSIEKRKTQRFFGTLGTLPTPYPLFYRKKVTIAIPFASPESISETKGGGQPSP